MSKTDSSKLPVENADRVREAWLTRLTSLVDKIERWGRELDWSTRRLNKRLEDAELGTYLAPGLQLQKEFVRILLEPLGRSAPGVEGVVDLYLMPAYDDIASLYYYDGDWHVHYPYGSPPSAGSPREAPATPLNKRSFQKTLRDMTQNASEPR